MSDQAPENPHSPAAPAGEKHRIMLPRALREKDDVHPTAAPHIPLGRRARRQRAAVWVVVLFIAAAVGGALLLLERMQDDNRLQDCVMSGRKNCAPLDPNLGR
jgi:hypothetical protein